MIGDNAPEFHDRFSIHPRSVETCRKALMAMAERCGTRAEEEVEALSDWETVQKVESLHRGALGWGLRLQGVNREIQAAAARFADLGEALIPALGERLAEETELFLAIDHDHADTP